VGSLGGVVAPNVLAYAKAASGSFSGSLAALSAFALVTGLLAASLSKVART
jgi:nitrate/nitrite transporter NarK